MKDDPMNYVPFWITSILDAAIHGQWPLRCELRKAPSRRLADYLD